MGSLITKLFFPNRQELRIKNSERKRSWLGLPRKGRDSKEEKAGVKPSEMLASNENNVVVKTKVSKTKNVLSLSQEGAKGPTFGRGFKKKLETTNNLEVSTGTYKKADTMFGGCIGDFVDDDGVNKFVKWSVEAIVSTGAGVRTDALYRASGGQEDISAISKQGEEHMKEVLKQETNVHVLTGVLKLFFRSLKEPILNIDDFQDVLEATTNDEETGKLLTKVIENKLSKVERATIAFFFLHLTSVLQYPDNKMTAEGMGVVFGPTLMRPGDDITTMQADMKRMHRLVELLLTHCHLVFGPRRPSKSPHNSMMSQGQRCRSAPPSARSE